MIKKVLLVWCMAVTAAVAQGSAPSGNAAEKVLMLEVTVPAQLPEVWKAFTTSEGLSTWLTPGAVVDLREGGEWTAHFPGGSTGGFVSGPIDWTK